MLLGSGVSAAAEEQKMLANEAIRGLSERTE